MAAYTCYAALSPFLNAPSRLVPLRGTKRIRLLFGLFKAGHGPTLLPVPEKQLPTIPLISCSQELTKRWECNCTLQRQPAVFKLYQLEK